MAQKMVNICDVCSEIFAGGDAPKERISNVRSAQYNVPVYSNGEANKGLYGYTDIPRVTKPSITISARGTIGFTAIREEPFVPIVRLISLTPKLEIIDIKYLYYAVQNYHFNGSGTSIPQLTIPMLKEYNFPLTSLPNQHHIAAVLDKVSDVIRLRKQQLAKLDGLIKARFVEMFGDPIVNEMGWKTVALNDACDRIGDGLHGTPEYDINGDYPFINGNNLMSGVIEITPATKMVNEETYKKHYIEITENALLLSINGTLGKLAFYNGEKVMLGKSVCYCNLKPEMNRKFVYGVMETNAFSGFVESNSTASTIKNVGLKAIRGFRLILPPEDLQLQFEKITKQVDKSKAAVQKALDETQLLFDSLMQKYFG